MLYRDQGVVLRTIKLGEADRIVTILTQGHGKVRAVAKGIRKTGEPVRGPARADEPRRVPVLPGPRARRRHPGRDDRRQPRAARALRLSHPRGVDARGRRPGRAGARAEPGALPDARRARCARWRPSRSPLVSAAFFWKLLSLEGFHPLLDVCARCGDEADAVRRPSTSRTAACSARRAGACGGRRRRTRGARAARAGSSAASCDGALAEPPGAGRRTRSSASALAALEHHVERRLRSGRAAL